jgi:HPt (histidine-containing phosphotransfer) domain-containing protein
MNGSPAIAGVAARATESASHELGEDTLSPLRVHLSPGAFREIVTAYETTVRNRTDALAVAARFGNFDEVRRNAHDLAGMCGQLGASRSTLIARHIEEACASGKGCDAFALVPKLLSAIAETLAALARLDQ